MKRIEQFLEWGGVKREIALLAVSGAALLASAVGGLGLPFDPAWAAIVLCGVPIVLEAVVGLVTAFDIKADVLVSLALIAAVWIGEDFAAGEVAFIMQLGGLLEDLTVARARAGIERLVRLTPRTARRIRNGEEQVVPAQQVELGDRLRVLPGETVAVDGIIRSGQTSIDQSVMTGESMPVDKGPGDEVFSGTVNQFGAFDMEATRVGEDSALQRMIRLVQSADAGKAKIVHLADRWATWVVVIALAAAGGTWLVTREAIRSVTILVVFCPCAMVLATPTAIMAAIGNATRHGFLVREGDALERLAGVKKFAFDKTGTLTVGQPQVVAVCSFGAASEEEIYRWAAMAEARSEHPLGKAVVRCWRAAGHAPVSPDRFEMIPGRGVRSEGEGRVILAGSAALLRENGAAPGPAEEEQARPYLEDGCTVIYLAADGTAVGFLALADTLRPDAARTVAEIRSAGAEPVLLTGDHQRAARRIGAELAITEIHAGCLPEDKMAYIDSCGAENIPVCMVGDGINDAPALKRARVGIAMGGVGSDIAVDAADIALVGDDIHELPHLLRLARRMMTTIRWNLTFSMGLNLVAIVLAIDGRIDPVLGALVHNAGSVFVMICSAFLLKWKAREQL